MFKSKKKGSGTKSKEEDKAVAAANAFQRQLSSSSVQRQLSNPSVGYNNSVRTTSVPPGLGFDDLVAPSAKKKSTKRSKKKEKKKKGRSYGRTLLRKDTDVELGKTLAEALPPAPPRPMQTGSKVEQAKAKLAEGRKSFLKNKRLYEDNNRQSVDSAIFFIDDEITQKINGSRKEMDRILVDSTMKRAKLKKAARPRDSLVETFETDAEYKKPKATDVQSRSEPNIHSAKAKRRSPTQKKSKQPEQRKTTAPEQRKRSVRLPNKKLPAAASKNNKPKAALPKTDSFVIVPKKTPTSEVGEEKKGRVIYEGMSFNELRARASGQVRTSSSSNYKKVEPSEDIRQAIGGLSFKERQASIAAGIQLGAFGGKPKQSNGETEVIPNKIADSLKNAIGNQLEARMQEQLNKRQQQNKIEGSVNSNNESDSEEATTNTLDRTESTDGSVLFVDDVLIDEEIVPPPPPTKKKKAWTEARRSRKKMWKLVASEKHQAEADLASTQYKHLTKVPAVEEEEDESVVTAPPPPPPPLPMRYSNVPVLHLDPEDY